MKTLPPGLQLTRRTPEFTAFTIPAGLLHDHRTKPGVWGVIQVLEGALEYHILEPIEEKHVLTPQNPGVVEPAMRHAVHASGAVRFYVEFHAAPQATQPTQDAQA